MIPLTHDSEKPMASMIAVVVINYQNTDVTLACLDSLYKHAGAKFHLFLVDNSSTHESQRTLSNFLSAREDATLILNEDNKGFSGGCNQAISKIFDDPRFHSVALLNNDTIIEVDWLSKLSNHLNEKQKTDMVAARMMQFQDPKEVDSLGIVFYKSGIASNRKCASQPLLGPCGGAALYSVRLLKELQSKSGYVFDPNFFCYAEDTDLALRARALGFGCAFADDAIVLHRGSHSTGGGQNEFIAYYGLRNSIVSLAKNLPAKFLARNFGWLTLMQLAVTFKYVVKGKPRLIWHVYRDAMRLLPEAFRQRRRLKNAYPAYKNAWRNYTSNEFYEREYIFSGLKNLFKRDIEPAENNAIRDAVRGDKT